MRGHQSHLEGTFTRASWKQKRHQTRSDTRFQRDIYVHNFRFPLLLLEEGTLEHGTGGTETLRHPRKQGNATSWMDFNAKGLFKTIEDQSLQISITIQDRGNMRERRAVIA